MEARGRRWTLRRLEARAATRSSMPSPRRGLSAGYPYRLWRGRCDGQRE